MKMKSTLRCAFRKVHLVPALCHASLPHLHCKSHGTERVPAGLPLCQPSKTTAAPEACWRPSLLKHAGLWHDARYRPQRFTAHVPAVPARNGACFGAQGGIAAPRSKCATTQQVHTPGAPVACTPPPAKEKADSGELPCPAPSQKKPCLQRRDTGNGAPAQMRTKQPKLRCLSTNNPQNDTKNTPARWWRWWGGGGGEQ